MYVCFIIFVYCLMVVSIRHSQVVGMMFQGLDFCGAFIFYHDIDFARSQDGLVLADRFPSSVATRAENEKTIERTKLE